MLLNPIFALELRARWRMNRSFALVLGLALALSGAALFIYQRAVLGAGAVPADPLAPVNSATGAFNQSASVVGRELFGALAQADIVLWLLLSAALAATGIARERERGLLESLQLSAMSAPGQIAARAGATLLLLGALQTVLLPIYSLAFLMGGVSPADIARAFALVGAASVLGTALGLWFSARSHRPTGALFGALACIALFSGLSFYWIQDAIGWAKRGSLSFDWTETALALLHPNALFWALTDTTATWTTPLWHRSLVVIAVWVALVAALLWSATRQVNRTLAPPLWQSRSRWVEQLKARQSARPARSARAQKASGALLADLPLERLVRFSDPLLAREVKGRFRLRQAGFLIGLVRFALFLGAVSLWIFEISWLADAPSRAGMVPSALRCFLYGGTLVLAALAATSWTRERESGTWESLKLSLLSPREILRAKWLSPLVSFALYSAPLWILLPVGALFIRAGQTLMASAVVVCWLGLATALGLWISWRVNNGAASIAWASGILALLLVALPWLNGLAGIDDALARWKYGVSGYENRSDLGGYGAPYRPDIVQNYQAQTGAQVEKPHQETYGVMSNQGTPIATRTYTNYSDSNVDFWLEKQIASAREFEANLRAWHPDIALRRIFGESERAGTNYYDTPESPRTAQAPLSFAIVTLAPLGVTLVLLLLLRRDVRREQLNS